MGPGPAIGADICVGAAREDDLFCNGRTLICLTSIASHCRLALCCEIEPYPPDQSGGTMQGRGS